MAEEASQAPPASPPGRTEVEKCVLLISPPVLDELTEPRSSGSHFSLCSLPRLILISQRCPPPRPSRPASAPQGSRSSATNVRARQAAVARKLISRSLHCPPARKNEKRKKKKENSTGSETTIHMWYIIHGSCAESRMESRSVAQPARQSASGPARAWEKRKKQIFYPDKLPY